MKRRDFLKVFGVAAAVPVVGAMKVEAAPVEVEQPISIGAKLYDIDPTASVGECLAMYERNLISQQTMLRKYFGDDADEWLKGTPWEK